MRKTKQMKEKRMLINEEKINDEEVIVSEQENNETLDEIFPIFMGIFIF